MAELPTYDFANYPAKGFIERKVFEDPTDEDADLIKQYENYISNGDIASAKQLLTDNPDLSTKMFGTQDGNTLYEELRNTEIVASQEKQSIYYGDKPLTYKVNDIWISDVE